MKVLKSKKGQIGEILVVVILLVLAVVGVVKFILPMFNSTTSQMDDVSSSLTNLSGDSIYGAEDGSIMQGSGVISDINTILNANVNSGNAFDITVTHDSTKVIDIDAGKAGGLTELTTPEEDVVYKNGKYLKTYTYATGSNTVLSSIDYKLR